MCEAIDSSTYLVLALRFAVLVHADFVGGVSGLALALLEVGGGGVVGWSGTHGDRRMGSVGRLVGWRVVEGRKTGDGGIGRDGQK